MSDVDYGSILGAMPKLDMRAPEVRDADARQAIANLNARINEMQSQSNAMYGLIVALVAHQDDSMRSRVSQIRDQLKGQDPKAAQFVDTILDSIRHPDTPVQ